MRSHIYPIACFVSSLLVVLAPGARAITDEVHGACGVPGMSGEPGAPGESGGDGEDIAADAQAGSDAENHALAYSGCGGWGGDGGEGDPVGERGGDGGQGGDASAFAQTIVESGDALAEVIAGGGGGGFAGAGGHSNGGGADGPGGDGGDGGLASIAAYASSANGGDVVVTGRAEGGDGGDGGNRGTSGIGGDGASVSLIDAVDGDTSGNLTLEQDAQGGRAGSAGTGGHPGDAFSALDKHTSSASLTVIVRARGGDGGNSYDTFASNGRNGDSIANAENDAGAANAHAESNGGLGGGSGEELNGGAGGEAAALSSAAGGGEHGAADAVAIAAAGAGGGAYGSGVGGNGGHGEAASTALATGDGDATADTYVEGGIGDAAHSLMSGDGGSARGHATATNTGTGDASATVFAYGGSSSHSTGPAVSGDGGDAEAYASASAPRGTIRADAQAFAGSPASASGRAGSALAQATGSGTGVVEGFANASPLGLALRMTASATTPALGADAFAEARASGGLSIADWPALSAARTQTLAMALPLDDDVRALLADNPGSRANYDLDAAYSVLGIARFGATRPEGDGNATIYDSVTLDVDPSVVPLDQHPLVSFIDPVASGAGFESLHLAVYEEGESLLDASFDDLASALLWFDDRTVDLGTFGDGGADHSIELTFALDATLANAGDGFGFEMIFGNSLLGAGPPVPLPAPLWLLCSAFAALGAFGRLRSRTLGHAPRLDARD